MPYPAPFDDELVDRLFDGSLPADDAPASLAGVAGLLDLARQGPEAAELGAEHELVTAMATTLAGGSEPVEARVSRTRRVVALTALCTLGLATAAAALGAVSTSRQEPPGLSVSAVAPTATDPDLSLPTSVPPTTAVPTSPAPSTSTSTSTEETTVPTTVPLAGTLAPTGAIGPDATGPAAFGLCTAWHEGKDRGARLDAPPFVNLAAAAEDRGLTAEEYCAEVFEAHAAGSEGGPGATAPGRETSATAPGHGSNTTTPSGTAPGATAPGATAPGRSQGGGHGGAGSEPGSPPDTAGSAPGRGHTPGTPAPGRP